MAKVATTVGDVDESDLRITVSNQESSKETWVMARECVYIGAQFPEERGTVVRRDVWVTFKVGQAAQAVTEL